MFCDVRAVFSKILISVTRDIALDQIVVAELEFKLELEGLQPATEGKRSIESYIRPKPHSQS